MEEESNTAWAEPAEFMPAFIKSAFSDYPSSIESKYWSEPEKNALFRILNSLEMVEVFDFLSGFDLKPYEVIEVVCNCFVSNSVKVLQGDDYDFLVIQNKERILLDRISRLAFDLANTLQYQDADLPTRLNPVKDVVEETEIVADLYWLISKCTSASWPEAHAHQLRNSDSVDDGVVETLMEEETPWLMGVSELEGKRKGFPSPIGYDLASSKLKGAKIMPSNRFLKLALSSLDSISRLSKPKRTFDVVVSGNNRRRPSSREALFFEPAHWVQIFETLFFKLRAGELDKDSEKRSVRRIIDSHYKNSPFLSRT